MAIFPVVEEEITQEPVITDRGINFLFDFELNDFILKDGKFIELYGDAAVIFWIDKTLRTEYEKSAIYQNTGYGTELLQLKGKTMPQAVASTIAEAGIKNALLTHERIASIENFEFSQEFEKVTIGFEVEFNAITPNEEIGSSSEDGFTRIGTLQEIKDFIGIKLMTNGRLYFKTSIGTQVYLNN